MKQFMSDSDSLNGILYWLQFIHCLRGRFSLQMLHIVALRVNIEYMYGAGDLAGLAPWHSWQWSKKWADFIMTRIL
jgi:hypothetical protein